MQLGTVKLPDNLYWENEFDFKSAVQSTTRTLTGSLLVQCAALHYGQSIRLVGDAWLQRSDLAALRALESQPVESRILTLGSGDTHAVIFDLAEGGLRIKAVMPESNPDDQTLYSINLFLLTVEP